MSVLSARESVKYEILDFFNLKEGSSLRAWVKFFDVNNDQRITPSEFYRGMRTLGYKGDPTALFEVLDEDGSGELSLDELDSGQAQLWTRFRAWCTEKFEGSAEMIAALAGEEEPPSDLSVETHISCDQFAEGIRRLGWTEGFEVLLFQCNDGESSEYITANGLRWLDVERRRRARKEQARQRATSDKKAVRQEVSSKVLIRDFKRTLLRTYGGYIRAWRSVLSANDSMIVPRAQFFKACSIMEYPNPRQLWYAFGKKEAGCLVLEELDAASAEILAHFKALVAKLGGASSAFQVLDCLNTKRLRQPQFMDAMEQLDRAQPAKVLFHGLDRRGEKYLVAEDLKFLDKWNPASFLIESPNHDAAEKVRALLIEEYGSYLKAWRRIFDSDGTNHCGWTKFCNGCKKLGYDKDIPGAWRALDADLSGTISLEEIDPAASDVLTSFRQWALEEFGGVRAAFRVFDTDGSNGVTSREFCRACRIYGYTGDAHMLYKALDVVGDGTLSMKEVAFLDFWVDEDEMEEDDEDTHYAPRMRKPLPLPSTASKSSSVQQTSATMPSLSTSRTPRLTTELPERVWWHTAPRSPGSVGMEGSIPKKGLADLQAGPAHTAWCSRCRARGPCRHLNTRRQQAAWELKELLSPRAFDLDGDRRKSRSARRHCEIDPTSLARPGTSQSQEMQSLKPGRIWSPGAYDRNALAPLHCYSDKPPLPLTPSAAAAMQQPGRTSSIPSSPSPSLGATLSTAWPILVPSARSAGGMSARSYVDGRPSTVPARTA
eukprot:TRINITY_DN11509_c0_g1_i1.p1 TRINITY_DN11509_c0_g1~~TRINITY_DN11509_c0_g1_i1.p1  ORF type:complete len:772 (+),score=141.79 TRINITY_DN11509_c0_g1_i1:127-2442(+)